MIPYVADQLAMRELPRATYALMVSLLPATATVIGVVVLAQVPTAAEIAGVGAGRRGRGRLTATTRILKRHDPGRERA